MLHCPCFEALVDTFCGIEGIVRIIQRYAHYIHPEARTSLIDNQCRSPWRSSSLDIYTVWPIHGPRVTALEFIGRMEKFRALKQEYVSARATSSRTHNIGLNIVFTYFNGVYETSARLHTNESFWSGLCACKSILRYNISQLQTKLLGQLSQHAVEPIKDIVNWTDNAIYTECIANGLWYVIHANAT
jgi:hypothetical protein